jgi:carboxypeptidase Taq
MDARSAYDELLRRSREGALLASCADLLGWDEETYMPAGGVANRAEQLALLAGLQHEKATDPRVGDLLAAVDGSDVAADPAFAANVREWRRRYRRQARVPRPLVEELARATSLAQQEWAAARQDDDFARFRPWLERVLALRREEAGAIDPAADPYDVLLDEYEPGATGAGLARLFDDLRRELAPLVEAIAGAPRRSDVTVLRREYPADRQRDFAEMAAAAVGFDFHGGRLDAAAAHPFFCTVGPGDCRITTRYDAHDFRAGFFGTLHEVGHALYEQGLPADRRGEPAGEAPSLGLHESQARLWENTVGRSRPFWEHFLPHARRHFPAALYGVRLDAFYLAVNHVEPSYFRVGADEVTYNLHILLRFDLERALVAGGLCPADVPGAWEEASRRCLGVVPPTAAKGCLQDGHWGSGLFGYFPTYTLGNLIAAQLYARASEEAGGLERSMARGDFSGLLLWLRERVYRPGHVYPAAELVERATGAPLSHRPLVEALRRKYGELYRV